jgi:hypothetical protein
MKDLSARLRTALAAVLTLTSAGPALAHTFPVKVDSDTVDPSDNLCSIREALNASNSNTTVANCGKGDASGDTIELQAGHIYRLNSQFTIAEKLTIKSNTTSSLATIVGVDTDYALYLFGSGSPTTLTLQDLVITHNATALDGNAGLYVDQTNTANATRVVVRNNPVGIILNTGVGSQKTVLACTQCSVHDNNNKSNEGGGILALGPSTRITLTKSAVYNNRGGLGAGILNRGELVVDNSTVSDNVAEDAGAGILHDGASLVLTNSTVVRNLSTNCEGSNVARFGFGTIRYTNSIVSLLTDECHCEGIFDNGDPNNIKSDHSIAPDDCLPASRASSSDLIDFDPGISSTRSTSFPELVGYKPASNGKCMNHGPSSPSDDEFSHTRSRGDGKVDTGALDH